MARSDSVWAIDLGQCALKALHCRRHSDPTMITVDGFDFIEYPKILSQPEANPAELIADALKEFLSRNSVRGDHVAISVAGQNGLARFIKLPPVESKKIPDIVKYEARQQIPFALEDVIWDYQQLAGGSEEDGFALETEVGLFAMKREQVYRSLEPYTAAEIEVDTVQLTPLALYNFVAFDQLPDLPPPDEYDPDNPPQSLVVLSLGTDTTDLVITNGYRVWQRSIPLGGSHFTKALTKEMKLTFAKAEHVKRNVAQAEDQKAVFQAMRPIFSDLGREVQLSLNHYRNIDRKVNYGKIVALGNGMKLPGLQRFLNQQLAIDVVRLETFRGLEGPTVLEAAAFKDNLLSFGTCYGLAVQVLGDAKLRTNLVPRELVKDRLIRAKKPWGVGVAALLLMGLTIGYFGDWRAWSAVTREEFQGPVGQATSTKNAATQDAQAFDTSLAADKTLRLGAEQLVGTGDERERWLNLWQAIQLCLPDDPAGKQQPDDFRERIVRRDRLYISRVLTQRSEDVAAWHANAKAAAAQAAPAAAVPPGAPPPGTPDPNAVPPVDPNAPPPGGPPAEPPLVAAGPGWIIELQGHHYHNGDAEHELAQYVNETLVANLERKTIKGPDGKEYAIGGQRIGFPVLIPTGAIRGTPEEIEDPEAAAALEGNRPKKVTVTRYNFVVQFAWLDPPPPATDPSNPNPSPGQ